VQPYVTVYWLQAYFRCMYSHSLHGGGCSSLLDRGIINTADVYASSMNCPNLMSCGCLSVYHVNWMDIK
jgi:hypothetical protein